MQSSSSSSKFMFRAHSEQQEQQQVTASNKDCLSCRIVGTGTLAGSALYVFYHQQQIPKSNRKFDRFALAGFSLALGAGAIWRWFVE
jgi:hypothetical protein